MKKIRRIITEYPCVCAGGDAITLYEQPRLKETGIIAIRVAY